MTAAPHVDRAERFVSGVLAGIIPANRWIRLACERHRRERDAFAEEGRWRFRPDLAERACNMIELLPHVEGDWALRGETLRLEDWQCFVVCSLHGWRERETGLKRFRDVYIEVGRKNAKTTLLSGLSLYALGFEEEAGGQVYSAAASKDQARIVFDIAKKMVERTPALEQKKGLVAKAHRIEHIPTGSRFEPLASQTKTLDGKGPHFVCLDELHAHKTREVHDVLRSGMGARSQPMQISITTAGYNTTGICFEIRRDVQRMLEGALDAEKTERLFGLIFCADEGDAPGDPATWAKANPNIGVSISEEFLRQEWNKAELNPAQMGEFLRKHLCVWTSVGATAFDLDGWAAGRRADLTLEDFRGLPKVVIGLDGSKSEDFTSLTVEAYDGEDEKAPLLLWSEHWATQDVIKRTGNEHLQAWVAEGWLTECPGALIDHGAVEARVREVAEIVGAHEIAYDPQYLLGMAQRLSEKGFMMVEQRQNTLSLDPGFREAQGLVRDKRVIHRGDPVMTWMVGNTIAQISRSGELIHPAKIGPADKIDGVQAWLTGMARLEAPEPAQGPSVYETRGILAA